MMNLKESLSPLLPSTTTGKIEKKRTPMPKQQTRYYFVDCIRGFAIINMVVFHFLYDVFIIYNKNPGWYALPGIHIWQQFICWTFIFISGFVWTLGAERNARRGLLFNLYGLTISFVTLLVTSSYVIWFGILNFIGCAILLMFPIEKVVKKVSPAWGLGVCFILFLLCKRIQDGYIGIDGLFRIPLPEILYSIKILTPFGFPFLGFRSSDYFPILPWILLFLCGYFFQRIFIRHKTWRDAACLKIPYLSSLGSKTIWIYLAHQPISMLICSIIF